MGLEFSNLNLDELDDMLYEVSKDNTKDMSTFINLLIDMYGGIDTSQFNLLHDFIHQELDIHTDAELVQMNKEQKLKIIEFINS